MLAEQPIDVMLLSTDLDEAKEFYGDRIGLDILIETDDFVTFKCGGDSRLVLTKSSTGSSDEATKASWRVDDLAAELEGLRARGVEIGTPAPHAPPAGRNAASTRVTFELSTRDQVATASPEAFMATRCS